MKDSPWSASGWSLSGSGGCDDIDDDDSDVSACSRPFFSSLAALLAPPASLYIDSYTGLAKLVACTVKQKNQEKTGKTIVSYTVPVAVPVWIITLVAVVRLY